MNVMASLCGVLTLTVAAIGVSARSDTATASQSREAVQAFAQISTVLSSPRCANCHIAGDGPLQGDDSHPHTMNVRRGADGRGAPAMRCTNCHQDASVPTPHAPPGAPGWRLPAAATPMAWRSLTPGDQCRMLKDRTKNGNRSLADLLDHASHDPIVLAGWNPGPGRAAPPLSHEAFVEQFKIWIAGDAACPE
jgi:hypothetical protein